MVAYETYVVIDVALKHGFYYNVCARIFVSIISFHLFLRIYTLTQSKKVKRGFIFATRIMVKCSFFTFATNL